MGPMNQDDRTLRFAIIGMGVMGRKHYKALDSIDGVEITGIVEPMGYEDCFCPVYHDVEQLLKKEEIDCAIIATPTSTHMTVAAPLIKNNKHILIEKPITKNINDAEYIKRLSLESQSKIAVGYVERFNPAVQSFIKNSKDESIISCEAKRVGPYPTRITDVGVRLDLSVHDVDLIRFLVGEEITECHGADACVSQIGDNEDNAVLFLRMRGGACATINCSWAYPFRERMLRILTDKSYYEVDLYNFSASKYTPHDNSKYIKENLWIQREDPLIKQLKEFINYVTIGKVRHLATLEDGLKSLKTVLGKA